MLNDETWTITQFYHAVNECILRKCTCRLIRRRHREHKIISEKKYSKLVVGISICVRIPGYLRDKINIKNPDKPLGPQILPWHHSLTMRVTRVCVLFCLISAFSTVESEHTTLKLASHLALALIAAFKSSVSSSPAALRGEAGIKSTATSFVNSYVKNEKRSKKITFWHPRKEKRKQQLRAKMGRAVRFWIVL